ATDNPSSSRVRLIACADFRWLGVAALAIGGVYLLVAGRTDSDHPAAIASSAPANREAIDSVNVLGAITDRPQRGHEPVALRAAREERRQHRASRHRVREHDPVLAGVDLPVPPAVAEEVVAPIPGQPPGETVTGLLGIIVHVEAERQRPDAD